MTTAKDALKKGYKRNNNKIDNVIAVENAFQTVSKYWKALVLHFDR